MNKTEHTAKCPGCGTLFLTATEKGVLRSKEHTVGCTVCKLRINPLQAGLADPFRFHISWLELTPAQREGFIHQYVLREPEREKYEQKQFVIMHDEPIWLNERGTPVTCAKYCRNLEHAFDLVEELFPREYRVVQKQSDTRLVRFQFKKFLESITSTELFIQPRQQAADYIALAASAAYLFSLHKDWSWHVAKEVGDD